MSYPPLRSDPLDSNGQRSIFPPDRTPFDVVVSDEASQTAVRDTIASAERRLSAFASAASRPAGDFESPLFEAAVVQELRKGNRSGLRSIAFSTWRWQYSSKRCSRVSIALQMAEKSKNTTT